MIWIQWSKKHRHDVFTIMIVVDFNLINSDLKGFLGTLRFINDIRPLKLNVK